MTDSIRTCDVARITEGADERRQHASADVAPELYDAPRRDSTRERTPGQTATDGTATEQR